MDMVRVGRGVQLAVAAMATVPIVKLTDALVVEPLVSVTDGEKDQLLKVWVSVVGAMRVTVAPCGYEPAPETAGPLLVLVVVTA